MRKIFVSAVLVAALVTGSLFVAHNFLPGLEPSRAPRLAPVAPLEPVTRSSTIIAPVAIAHSAIRSALDAQAPRKFEGKQEKPITDLLNNSSISWTVERGPLSVATRDERLILSTPLTGAAHLSGQISNKAGDLVGALGGILNQGLGQDLQRITGQTIGQDGQAKDDPILRTLFHSRNAVLKASHGFISTRRIQVAVVISLLALVGVGWLAWPYYALYDLWSALREGDTARLENRIAWDSLREGLRGDLNALFLQKMRAKAGAGNSDLGAGLAMVLAPAIINQVIDGYLTPQAVGNLLRTGKPQQIGTETSREDGSLDSNHPHQFSLKQIRYAFFSGGPLRFKVEVVPPETDQPVQGILTLLFRWNGDWRLTRVILPADTGDAFEHALGTSAEVSKSAKAATPSKPTEPAPFQVNLVKNGFKNANHKAFDYDDELTFVLSIRNLADRDVRAFDGVLTFTDLLDNIIMSSKLAINDAVRAGSTLNWDGRIKYNQFIESHKRLRAEDQANLKVSFTPRKIFSLMVP